MNKPPIPASECFSRAGEISVINHVLHLPEGWDYEMIFEPSAWKHHARKVLLHDKIWVHLRGRPRFCALVDVVAKDEHSVVVMELFKKSAEVKIEAVTDVLFPKFINFGGEHWRIYSKHTKQPLNDQRFASKEDAIAWINAHAASMKAAA